MDELNTLSNLYAERDLLLADVAEQRRKIMEPVQFQLDALEEETMPMLKAVGEKIAIVEERAKSLVIANGASMKVAGINAVYVKGRVTWKSEILDGMAIMFPEIKVARKEGEPTVQFRRV